MPKKSMSEWLTVDRAGLAKLLARRGKAFIISELLQNAWDEDGITNVVVTLVRPHGSRNIVLTVKDDAPDGFGDLAHAYTMFAESRKKADATKRGRFNMGEKLILALASEARIISTRGGWLFDREGRHRLRRTLDRGSTIEVTLPLTGDEVAECDSLAQRLLPPAGIRTTYNGVELMPREVAYSTEEFLPTEVTDAEGNLRRSTRKARVDLIRITEGEEGWLYELGIPVVATGDSFHVNVHQKVPLNMERDSVPPAFLRKVRTATLNLAYTELDHENANAMWAREALADPNVSNAAVEAAFKARFGKMAVVYDPNDPEANKRAVSEGFTVVHGSQLNRHEWANVKRAQVVLPAGQVTPSPKPYSQDGNPEKIIPQEKWTRDMRALDVFARRLAAAILEGTNICVTYVLEAGVHWLANYGVGELTINLGRLGKTWPEQGLTEDVLGLLVHEFGHQYSGDHLAVDYHDALCRIGARLALTVSRDPTFLSWQQYCSSVESQPLTD
ncbi:MAG: sensor histidine kinase [Betaproteobacteria bacterium]|nr:sensor histidine kinase [Betaproteobacteria bacterium]